MSNIAGKPLLSAESSPASGDPSSSGAPSLADLSLSKNDSNRFKIFKCTADIGTKVLYIIFIWGYKGKTKTISMYMNEIGVFEKLTKGTRLRISRNEPPSTFDTTLLFTVLQFTCGLSANREWNKEPSGSLERMIYEIKEYRNVESAHNFVGLTHEKAKEKIQHIEKTYVEALDIAGKKFGIQEEKVNGFKDLIQRDISKLMSVDFSIASPTHLSLANTLTNMIIEEGKPELMQFYKSQENVKLAPRIFESGRSAKDVSVTAIFTDRDLLSDENRLINAKDILSVRERWCSNNGVILITGCSGSGKTTLLNFLLHSWTTEKEETVKDILDYDLVLYNDCRTSSVSTLDQLVRTLIPKTADNMQDAEELKTALAPLKVLLLLDGVGKLEGHAKDLILSVLSDGSSNLHTICTTRRSGCYSAVQEMCQMAGKEIVRLDMYELSPYQRQDLMYNIIGEFGNEKLQTAGWNDMYTFLHSRGSWSASNFMSPLEVSLLTLLWLNSDDLVKTLPNGTSVLQHLEDFKTMLLVEKLAEEVSSRNVPMRILNSGALNVTKIFNKFAYKTLLNNGSRLSDECLKEFRQACTDNNLPFDEVLSVLTNVYVDPESHMLEVYTLSHNDLTFRSARYLCDQLESSSDVSVASLLPQYTEPYPKQRYHMLLLVTGLLAQRGLLDKHAESIVSMAKTEDLMAAEWFQILVEGKSQSDLCNHIGKAMSSQNCLDWKIRDSMVEGIVNILETGSAVPRQIELFLLSDPDTLPGFESLLKLLSTEYKNELRFELQHHYVSQSRSDEVFSSLCREEGLGCNLTSFQGCLKPENIARLPSNLTWLCLRVNFFEMLAVAELLPSLRSLTSLELLIDDPQLNRPSTYPTLVLSARVLVAIPRLRDEDISWACEMLGTILKKEFWKIKLFGCQLTFQGCKEFISGLKERGVMIHPRGNLQTRFEKAVPTGRTRELVQFAKDQGFTLEVRKGG